MKPMLLAAITILLNHAALAADVPAPAAYTVAGSIALGAGERWDYVTYDPVDQRAYVAHGDHVSVVDTAKQMLVGEIGTFPGGTHGVAIVHDANVGYTDDAKAGEVIAFDLRTLQVTKKIKGDEDADGIVYDAASKHVFVINGDSGTVTVIDPRINDAVATIRIGAGLEAAEVDGKGKLFVDGVEKHDLIAIDTKTNIVLAHYPMQGCERPHGIAVDAKARRVFATCINKVMVVMNADNGKQIASVPIGASSDGAAFDAKRKLVLSSNGEGTLSVIAEKDADHFNAQSDVATAKSARTIAIDPDSGNLFLPAASIAKIEPSAMPGGRPRTSYTPGSLKLLVLAPGK